MCKLINLKAKGADVTLTSTAGSIINETIVNTTTTNIEGGDTTRTTIGNTALIQSTNGNVLLNANNDIINKGADISSAKSVALITQEGDIKIQTIIDENANNFKDGRNFTKTQSLKHISSSIEAGDTIAMQSANDILLENAELKANDTVSLNAANDINILAVNDVEYEDTQSYTNKSFGRSKTKRDMRYEDGKCKSI